MKTSDKMLAKRTVMMVAGIAFISLCVGSYRLSGFGVDAFTCMNLGISGFLDMQFGTWQLIMNAAILVVVCLLARECIGAGTIVNMVCVGYGADLICFLVGGAVLQSFRRPGESAAIREQLRKQLLILKCGMDALGLKGET